MPLAVTVAPLNLEPVIWLIVAIIALAVLGLILYFLGSTIWGWLMSAWNGVGGWLSGPGLSAGTPVAPGAENFGGAPISPTGPAGATDSPASNLFGGQASDYQGDTSA